MCGIGAYTRDPAGAVVRAMCAEIVHRGPDDDGFHLDPVSGVALGARRLSVIDLVTGHQPMTNETGAVAAALNGEIYNFSVLRDELVRRGHQLRTHCDTEVLVHLYEDYGPDLVHALEGMFAFVLWDAQARVLVAARDRFGEKPLFYTETGGELALASEATALTRTGLAPSSVSPAAVDEYFVLGYVQAPRTIFEAVQQVPPGHLLTWHQSDRKLALRPYWQPPVLDAPPRSEGLRYLAAEAGELLTRSMRGRLVADVPLGLFLSGGIDSALVAALAAKVHCAGVMTFTIGYDVGSTNELEPARASARLLGTEHHELTLSSADVARRAPVALAQLDQPLADEAFIALHVLAEFARQSVTVAVGGEGAGELFGDYPRYRWLQLAHRLDRSLNGSVVKAASGVAQRAPSESRARRIGEMLCSPRLPDRHLLSVTAARRRARQALYGPVLKGKETSDPSAPWNISNSANGDHVAARLMRLDQMRWLPDDVLAMADRATMLTSLEMRTPFLHREVAEFAASVPVEVHLQDGGKALLRQVLRDLIGPKYANKRVKSGFRVPVSEWLRGPLAPALTVQLDKSMLYRDGWFDHGGVRTMFEAHRRRERNHADVLWPLFVLGCWFDAGAGARSACACL